jgi:hypothetical protein
MIRTCMSLDLRRCPHPRNNPERHILLPSQDALCTSQTYCRATSCKNSIFDFIFFHQKASLPCRLHTRGPTHARCHCARLKAHCICLQTHTTRWHWLAAGQDCRHQSVGSPLLGEDRRSEASRVTTRAIRRAHHHLKQE